MDRLPKHEVKLGLENICQILGFWGGNKSKRSLARALIPELHRNVATSAGAPWPNGRTEVGNDVIQHVGDFFPKIAMTMPKVFNQCAR